MLQQQQQQQQQCHINNSNSSVEFFTHSLEVPNSKALEVQRFVLRLG
jgi:hypothetical protein